MKLPRHPLVYLVGTNLVLWGLAFSANRIQAVFANLSLPRFSQPKAAMVPSESSESSRPAVSNALMVSGLFPTDSSSLFRDPLLSDLAVTDGSGKPEGPSKPQSVAEVTPSPLRHPTGPSLRDLSVLAANNTDNFFTQLTKADGLGGEVSLKTLSEPLMPIAAKVERLQQQRSTDMLSALPLHWREPLRQELAKRPNVSKVATVRIPVQGLPDRYEVPVIIDEKGEAEGLTTPQNAKAQAAVEKWMTRQKPSQTGTVSVMVVSAEPLPTKTSLPDPLLFSKSVPSPDPLPVAKPARTDFDLAPVSQATP